MRRVQEGMHVCCRIGGMLVGIDLDRLQEINRRIDPTFVPLLENYVRGVINLRGSLVTVIDVGQIVCGRPVKDSEQARTVVVELGEEVCGLVVDEVGDVVDISQMNREPLPRHMPAEHRRWFHGLVQLNKELLLVLNLDELAQVGRVAVKGAGTA